MISFVKSMSINRLNGNQNKIIQETFWRNSSKSGNIRGNFGIPGEAVDHLGMTAGAVGQRQ